MAFLCDFKTYLPISDMFTFVCSLFVKVSTQDFYIFGSLALFLFPNII